MLVVVGQGPHDLDRPRVFREHHLAFRAVDVVARVELLAPSEGAAAFVAGTLTFTIEAAPVLVSETAGAAFAAAAGGIGLDGSSRMSWLTVWVASVGSRNTSAPADWIIPLTR